jgi:ABC-type branched-subunit amino acid transport system substrate-binding protein
MAGLPRADPFRRYEMQDDLRNLSRAALLSAREMRSLIAVEAVRSASRRATAVIFATLQLLLNSATAEPVLDTDLASSEIRVGNVMPYSGPLSAFASIGRAEAAYFEMINQRGGINGRRVRLISYDDSSDPRIALEYTRNLVEQSHVLLMFGSFGTPSNFAVRPYLILQQQPLLRVETKALELKHIRHQR